MNEALKEERLARQLVQIQSEEELDRFIPLLLPAIKAVAPMLLNAAGPLLGGLFGGRRSPSRPQSEEEQFLGGIIGKLFGEQETESEEEEQFLGNILKGIFGGELEQEEEQFLGGLLGKLFGGREFEGENFVQEQFIGGLFRKILGREMEYEGEMMAPPSRRLHRARRLVRLALHASRVAARELMRLLQSGQRPTQRQIRRIVLGAFLATARRMSRRRPPGAPPPQPQPQMQQPMPQPPQPPQPGPGPDAGPPPQQGETILEQMIGGY